jgi:hypothetical protein
VYYFELLLKIALRRYTYFLAFISYMPHFMIKGKSKVDPVHAIWHTGGAEV